MATYTFDKIEYGGNIYVVSDSGALQLTGGNVTGPVNFGDSISVDDATLGDLVVNGDASFTNNLQANTINGVTVGSSPKFTDTDTKVTSSANHYTPSTASGNDKTASASGATAAWSIDVVKGITINTDGKGHITGLSVTSGKIPANPNSDTWRKVQLNGTDKLGTATSTNPLNLKAGTNVSIAESSGTFTFSATDTDTKVTSSDNHYTPSTASGSDKTASASGATAAWSIDVVKGITINTDGKGHITGLSVTSGKIPSNPNTDTKLTVAAVTSGTQYYPVVADGANAQKERQVDTTGFTYKGTNGTTSAVGSSILVLGNSTGSGTANNKQAQLIMYGSNTKKATITLAAPSADIALALPTSGGTIALTSQIPSVPTTAANKVTGISIADHSTTSVGSASGWSAGTASTWAFTGITVANSISGAVDSSDSTQLNITLGTTTVQSKSSGSNSTVPSLTITSTTVVNGKTHSITDSGHTHTLS